MALAALAVGDTLVAAALIDDIRGHGATAPLLCILIAAIAVAVLLAVRRRSAEDPAGARALMVLGGGLTFAALSASALLLAVYSIS